MHLPAAVHARQNHSDVMLHDPAPSLKQHLNGGKVRIIFAIQGVPQKSWSAFVHWPAVRRGRLARMGKPNPGPSPLRQRY